MIILVERVLILNDIELVKQFVAHAMMQNFDIELSSGKYTVNAKSIMGIFSLDLTKPVKMIAHCEGFDPFISFCEQYLYDEK